jgi:hypothetical protein
MLRRRIWWNRAVAVAMRVTGCDEAEAMRLADELLNDGPPDPTPAA